MGRSRLLGQVHLGGVSSSAMFEAAEGLSKDDQIHTDFWRGGGGVAGLNRPHVVAEVIDDPALRFTAPLQRDMPFGNPVERDDQAEAVFMGHEILRQKNPALALRVTNTVMIGEHGHDGVAPPALQERGAGRVKG